MDGSVSKDGRVLLHGAYFFGHEGESMGTIHPHASQLTLSLEEGLATRHLSLRDCMACGVYARGLQRVAGQIDLSPSKLSEKLAGGTDRKRDIGLEEFERYLDKTGDTQPILYLVARYLRDPDAQQQEALSRLVALADQLPGLLAGAGLARATHKATARRA
jgi:hypothetical protein